MSIFEKINSGEVPAQFIARSEQHGLAAILDSGPNTPGQTILFHFEKRSRLTDYAPREIAKMALWSAGISRHLLETLEPDGVDLIGEHVEGRNVEDHGHKLLLPSSEKGDLRGLYDPTARPETSDGQLDSMQDRLKYPDEKLAQLELHIAHFTLQSHQ